MFIFAVKKQLATKMLRKSTNCLQKTFTSFEYRQVKTYPTKNDQKREKMHHFGLKN